MTGASQVTTADDAPRRRFGLVWVIGALAVVALMGGGALGLREVLRNDDADPEVEASARYAPVVRNRFTVVRTEAGEIEAKQSVDVKCEVEGSSTIIWLIDEGTVVEAGDKLVELDSADLEEQLTSRRMSYDSAFAAYERAKQTYEIQKSTNESLLADAALTVKFALLDLKKYLGREVAERLVDPDARLDYASLVSDEALGGEALQQRRKLESDIDLAEEELKRGRTKAEWTRTLEKKGYVTGSELEADELAVKRQTVAVEQAKTALEIFRQYEFPKQAEQYFSDWREAKREYRRVEVRTASELATAKADLDAKQAAFELEKGRLAKTRTQLERAAITAPRDGMVVYARDNRRWGGDSDLAVGTQVRHQQTIIQLPDLSEMKVEAKVHESVVEQIREGSPASIVIDAWPDKQLSGRVTKVGVMPERVWYSSVKNYLTDVTLDDTPKGLKPGMSARVDILVADVPDALQVPVSAVYIDKGRQVVYVRTPSGRTEVRPIRPGLASEQAVQVLEGLEEGEVVCLFKPDDAPELPAEEVETDVAQRLADEGLPDETPAAPKRRAETPEEVDDEAARPALPPGVTPEQVEALKKRFENATPQERARMVEELRKRRERMGAEGDRPAPVGAGGREPGQHGGRGGGTPE